MQFPAYTAHKWLQGSVRGKLWHLHCMIMVYIKDAKKKYKLLQRFKKQYLRFVQYAVPASVVRAILPTHQLAIVWCNTLWCIIMARDVVPDISFIILPSRCWMHWKIFNLLHKLLVDPLHEYHILRRFLFLVCWLKKCFKDTGQSKQLQQYWWNAGMVTYISSVLEE